MKLPLILILFLDFAAQGIVIRHEAAASTNSSQLYAHCMRRRAFNQHV